MPRNLGRAQAVERSLIKRFRKELWKPFIVAVKRYELIREGDIVTVSLRGDALTLSMCKLLQELERHSEVPFRTLFTAAPELLPLAEETGIPLTDSIPACAVKALPICLDDVAEEALGAMLCEGSIHSVTPRLLDVDGGEIILPMYCIRRGDASAFARYNSLELPTLIQRLPGSRLSEHDRMRMSELVLSLREVEDGIPVNIFNALHNAQPATFPPAR